MNIPAVWTPEIWRRASTRTIPSVQVTDYRMSSEATPHHADCVGGDLWTVDFLRGRQLTREQARAAMRIAVAPDRPEVQRWAALLGLTAAEALGFIQLPEQVTL